MGWLSARVAGGGGGDGGVGTADSRARNPLTDFLHSFVDAARTQQHISEVQVPLTNFSPLEQEKIRNRSSVFARQFFPGTPPPPHPLMV